jgi:hypothetical protein
MKLALKLVYIGLLLPSCVVFVTVWQWCVVDVLFHCWDSVPILDFLPPFAHPNALLDGKQVDFYYVPEFLVYLLWIVFLAGILFLPALVIRICLRDENHIA